MKTLPLFAAALLALAITGCGGSGDSSSTPTPGINLTEPRIEAVVRLEQTNLRDPNKYSEVDLLDPTRINPNDLIDPRVFGVQDTQNLQTEESYYFQLVSYGPNGERVILPASFATNDLEYRHGTVASNSGLFIASDEPTTAPIIVYATYNGNTYSTTYRVNQRQVRLLGRVLLEGSGAPVAGVRFAFYTANSAYVGEVTSGYDGSIRASVPLGATYFTVIPSSLPANLQPQFVYQGLRYAAGDPDCRATLPPLELSFSDLGTVTLTARVVGQPAPALTGCQVP